MTRRGARKWYTAPLTPLLIVVVLLALHYLGVLKPIESFISTSVAPLQARLFTGGTNSQPEQQLTPEERVAVLEEENRNLQLANSQLQALMNDTGVLAEQLGFLRDKTYSSIQAKVTTRSTDQLAQTITINVGSNDGVQEGNAVIVNDGIFVGIVHAAQPNSSTVLLANSYNTKVGATVQNETLSPGIVSGEFNISLRLSFVPQTDTLTIGDSVITSGNDAGIPTGLLIGTIQEVFQEPGSLFQEASISPLYSVNELRIVSVVTVD